MNSVHVQCSRIVIQNSARHSALSQVGRVHSARTLRSLSQAPRKQASTVTRAWRCVAARCRACWARARCAPNRDTTQPSNFRRDPKPKSRHQTATKQPNLVTTPKLCRDTPTTKLCHDNKTRSRHHFSPTMSRHQKVCHDTEVPGPCCDTKNCAAIDPMATNSFRVMTPQQLLLSRREKSCHDPGPTWSQPQPCHDIGIGVATQCHKIMSHEQALGRPRLNHASGL